MQRKRKHFDSLWPAAGLVLIGLAVFANGLSAPFIFDDQESIVANPNILHLQPFGSALSAPPDTPAAGRPLASLSFAINYALGGFSPRGYHIWNLVVHLLNGLLVYGIVRSTLEGNSLRERFGKPAAMIAFASAAIWMVHPLQTEVVDYVTQRTESMMALFYLLTIYSAVRAMAGGSGSWRWSMLAVVACACGMACKESMVTAPVMVLLYDAVFGTGSLRRALRSRPLFYAGLASTWSILLVLEMSSPRGHSAGLLAEVSPWTYLLNQPQMIVRYLKLSLWPTSLVIDYGPPQVVPLDDVIPAGALLLALLVATAALWFRSRPLAFLGTWFFVTLAPASSLIPIATEVGAERRMYLPLAGLVIAVVSVVHRRTQTAGAWRRVVGIAGLVTTCGLLAALTTHRNAEYRDPVLLWQTVIDRRPQSRAHFGLGIELMKADRRVEARQHLEIAATGYPRARYALGIMNEQDGRHAEAVADLREYVRARPYDADVIPALNLVGRALTEDGKFDEAAATYEQVRGMQPRNDEARAGLANTLARSGLALVARDRMPEAVDAFARAVALDPGDPAKQENLGHALAAIARLDDAAVHYRQALALAPAKATLYSALGTVLLAQGKEREAMACFQRALELAPADEQVRMDVTAALRRLAGRRS